MLAGEDGAARYGGVPFFWTQQYTFGFQKLGFAPAWDELRFDTPPSVKGFMAAYLKGGRVVSVAAAQRGRQLAALHDRFREGTLIIDDLGF